MVQCSLYEDRRLATLAREAVTMSTAWAYLVVSSEAQAETLAHQEAWANEVARAHSWTITSTFRGVSSGRLGTECLARRRHRACGVSFVARGGHA
jgi:hypothetical protein